MVMEMLHIGQIASRIGVQPEAIRYYERRGLLPRPVRGTNRYRIYTREHLERVDFIKKAQVLGLSLEEIRQLLELKYRSRSPCQHVRDLLRQKLLQVEQQMARLQAFRRELKAALRACERAVRVHKVSKDTCPILDGLNRKKVARRNHEA